MTLLILSYRLLRTINPPHNNIMDNVRYMSIIIIKFNTVVNAYGGVDQRLGIDCPVDVYLAPGLVVSECGYKGS
jgi:hypothetical protein